MFGKCFDNVRQICPLVHNITTKEGETKKIVNKEV